MKTPNDRSSSDRNLNDPPPPPAAAVAQVCNLPYRRIAFGRPPELGETSASATPSRLPICATAECHSALRGNRPAASAGSAGFQPAWPDTPSRKSVANRRSSLLTAAGARTSCPFGADEQAARSRAAGAFDPCESPKRAGGPRAERSAGFQPAWPATPPQKPVGNRRSSLLAALALLALAVLPLHAQTNCTPPPAGLVGWWPGDGHGADIGGANNGTLMNGASFAPGVVGSAFSFDGVDDYVTATTFGMVVGTGDFTVEGWAKTTSTKSWNVLVSFDTYNPGIFITGSGYLELYPQQQSSLGGFNDGQFHHFGVVRTTGTITYFKDGVAAGTASYNGSVTPGEFLIGSDRHPSEYFPGIIDEVSIYNRALSSNEVAAIYAAGSAGKCSSGAPNIVLQPQSQTVSQWYPATFSVGATGSRPLAYQWQFNGTNLLAGTNATLTLTDVGTNHAGNYQVIITNQFGAATSSVAVLTVVPPTGAVYWDGGGDGSSWSDARNWSDNRLPNSTNVVIISGSNGVVTLNSGDVMIRTLRCDRGLNLAAGSLSLTAGASQIQGSLAIAAGRALSVSGIGASLDVAGEAAIDGASLYASGGATLSLPGLTSYRKAYGVNAQAWQASGAGSLLLLPALTNVVSVWHYDLQVKALLGGQVVLTNLTSLDGAVAVSADGLNSVVDLSRLSTVTGTNGSAYLIAQNNGVVKLPVLASAWATFTAGSGSGLWLPWLTAINNGGVTLNSGGTVSLPSLAVFNNSSLALNNGGTLSLPLVETMTNSSLTVSSGGTLSLPSLTSYRKTYNVSAQVWQASGASSLLLLPALTNVVSVWHYDLQVKALLGGQVVLTNLSSLDGAVTVSADGTNSVVDLSRLSTVAGNSQSAAFSVQNGGVVKLPVLASAWATFTAGSGSGLWLPWLTAINNGGVTLNSGGTVSLPSLAVFNNSSLALNNGGTLSLPLVETMTNSSLTVSSGGTLSLPSLTSYRKTYNVSAQVWQASGASSLLLLPALTNVVSVWHYDLQVKALLGGQVVLTNLTTLDGAVAVSADGTNSVVALNSLTDCPDFGTSTTFLEKNTGRILLPSPVDLTVTGIVGPATALAGQPIQISWTVRNQGVNPANGPRSDGVWLSTDRVVGGDTFLGHFPASTALAAGQEQAVTNTVIMPPGLSNSFYFIVMADSQYQFYEAAAETNNTFIATNAIVVSAPDLTITSLTGTNSSAKFGDKVWLSWVVKNIGSVPASGLWRDRVYLSTGGSVAADSVLLAGGAGRTNLDAGQSYTNSFEVTLPLNAGLAAKGYYLVAKADAFNDLAEANEANNTQYRSLSVTYPNLPDLAVGQCVPPVSGIPGQSVPVVWTVTNAGASTASAPWTEALYLVGDEVTSLTNSGQLQSLLTSAPTVAWVAVTNDLAAGASVTRTQLVAVPMSGPAGALKFAVWVDRQGDVVEQSETNNAVVAESATWVPQVLALQVPVTRVLENVANPNLTGLVSRNGSLSNALTVALASSHPTRLAFGPPEGGTTNIVIPAGEASAPFNLTVVWDHAPGPDQVVTITATAAAFSNATAVVTVVNTDTPTLSVVLSNLTVIEGGTVTGRVTRSYATAEPLAVALSSSQPVHLTVTNQVIIPANGTYADFTAKTVDDSLVEPPRSFSILASALGYTGDGASVLVLDNDVPELALVVSATNVMENAGPLALSATVYRSIVTKRALNVVLRSSQTNALLVPAKVTIPADLASVRFSIAAVNNTLMDGDKSVVVSAQTLDDLRGEPIGAVASQAITVQDDDGPGLAVALARKLVPEGLNPATTAVVSRNTPTTNDLVVTLTSSLTNEATVPVSVLISNGQTSATFVVVSLNDGVTDGSQTVTITASAPGLASGSDTLVVTDENMPDLVVAWVKAPTNALTEAYFSFSFRVENRGLAPSSNAILQKVYLPTDPYVGNDLPLMEVVFTGGITNGQYFEQALSSRLPKTPGDYWVVVVTDADNAVAEVLEDNNVAITAVPIHVAPAYSAVVQTDAGVLTNPGPVALYGHATATGGGPAAQAMVNIHLEVRGYHRVISAIANNYGDFATTFYPLPGGAGHYFIGAAHPGTTNWVAQDEFTMLGLKFDPAKPTARVVEGGSAVGQLRVSNLADMPLTNVVVSVVSHSANLLATANLSSNVLPALGDLTLAFAVTAISAAPAQASVVLRVTSAEGVSADLPIAVTVEPLRPVLVARPASLTAGMLRGGTVAVEFEVVNEGTLASGPINVLTPALAWLHVASANPLPSLAPGATNKVSLQLKPPADLALGPYQGTLVLLGTDANVTVPFNFRALSEAKGDLKIEVLDEFTLFSTNAPGVTNALVILSDAVSGAVVATNRTDATGTLSLTNLAEAYYQLDITASNHASYRATILLLAGQTNSVKAFLAYETVKYYWTVVPTEIEDRTRLVVETTFETFVPVPIVEIIPPVVDLLDYPNGGQFEVMITNHGWIAAQELRYSIPSHPCWEIKPMVEDLGTLPAFSSIKIPVTIRRLGDSGCQPCEFVGGVNWKVYAANLTNSYFTPQFFINAGFDCGVAVAPGGGGGGGGGGSFSGPVIAVSEPPCCAVQVKLRIDQEAVITRDAFSAALELVNGSAGALTGVGVDVEIRNRQGELAGDLFAVRGPTLSGIGAVDGSGVVNPMSTGKASWVLIPTSEAAPTNEVEYLVSGTLSYVQSGVPLRIPLAPTSIKVLPNAALQVKYFLQRDVFSDDPFTEVIEPSEPFALAVMLKNVGYGTARNVRITSAKPEIVENVSGLFIFFDILATEVAGQNMTPSLTANFGNLAPGDLRAGKWLFKSTLQGLFVDYAASFEHLDGLGDPRLSLIKSVEIHEMTRIVSDHRAGADTLPDYLVHDGTGDTNDWLDLPDTLYLSDGRVEPVSVVTTGAVSSAVGPGMLQVTVTAPMPAGWAYLRLPDPQGADGDRKYRLVRVQRTGGAELPAANFWQTDRTFLGHYVRPLNENSIHLLDFDSTGSYTLTYATTASTDVTPPVSAVLALPADSYEQIPLQWSGQDEAGGSGIAFYDIYVSDNGGAFTRWLTQTTATGAIYPGVPGHRYEFYSVAIDRAGNRESAPGMPDAQTVVTLFNVAPVLTVGPNQTVDEGATVLIPNSATDANAEQILTFSLGVPRPPGASGAAINPSSGLITWPTSEATGPSTNLFTVIVADNGLPPMSATGYVTVVVREVNLPPILAVVTNRVINEGFLLLITNSASDYDIPASALTFSLAGKVPDGASINETSGLFRWQPTDTQGPSTNLITVIVTDDGVPRLSATQQFYVVVRDTNPDFVLSLGSTNLYTGEANSVLVTLQSGIELTYITFDFEAADGRLTNWTSASVPGEVTDVTLSSVPPNRYRVALVLNPANMVSGSRPLARLDFMAVPAAGSAFVPLVVDNLVGLRSTGLPVANVSGLGGRVAIVDRQPLVDATHGPAGALGLVLYGHPNTTYLLQSTPNMLVPQWTDDLTWPLTNRFQVFEIAPETIQPTRFFRAREW